MRNNTEDVTLKKNYMTFTIAREGRRPDVAVISYLSFRAPQG